MKSSAFWRSSRRTRVKTLRSNWPSAAAPPSEAKQLLGLGPDSNPWELEVTALVLWSLFIGSKASSLALRPALQGQVKGPLGALPPFSPGGPFLADRRARSMKAVETRVEYCQRKAAEARTRAATVFDQDGRRM